MKRIAFLLVVAATVAGSGAATRGEMNMPGNPSLVETAYARESRTVLADEGPLPDLSGAIGWLNSSPLDPKSLRGKVVLVNFWTYSCINSLRELPYMKNWAAKYKDAGLVVIGVHAPEFGFEKDRANVEMAVHDLKVTCHRQQPRDLAGVQQRVLAGRLLH